MTGDALTAGFEALITGMTVYPGDVPADPDYPYVLVLTNFPQVSQRAMSRAVQGRALRARTIVVGLSVSSVQVIAQKLSGCLEGKKPAVSGWKLGRIESVPNDQLLEVDNDISVPDFGHPLYQPFDWILTGSQL